MLGSKKKGEGRFVLHLLTTGNITRLIISRITCSIMIRSKVK